MSIPQESEPISESNLPRPYEDVRQWLELVESMGELKRINGADWNLEIGTMAELIYRERSGTIPALLFDRIKGYPEGFRILFGQQTSYRRLNFRRVQRLCRNDENATCVILNKVKNLMHSIRYTTQILRLTPQNDITTQSLKGEEN